MAEFASVGSYVRFEHVIKKVTRFVRPSDVEEFLQTVLATATSREEVLKRGTKLWRAQTVHRDKPIHTDPSFTVLVPGPVLADRMKPFADRAKEGRASPMGIPVLYLATERDTALSEMRPGRASIMTVGEFTLLKDCRVVDCSVGSLGASIWARYSTEPPPAVREQSVWTDIDLAFALPVNPADDVADYSPTQIIAELFKQNGYDGIKYRSSMGSKGHNVALFDLAAADPDPASLKLFQPERIEFTFKDVT